MVTLIEFIFIQILIHDLIQSSAPLWFAWITDDYYDFRFNIWYKLVQIFIEYLYKPI